MAFGRAPKTMQSLGAEELQMQLRAWVDDFAMRSTMSKREPIVNMTAMSCFRARALRGIAGG